MSVNVSLVPSTLEGNDILQSKAIAKVFNEINFDNEDFSHAEVQWLFNNADGVEGLDLYSPVQTEAEMNESVPESWPGSTIEPLVTPEVLATYDEETGEELTPYEPPVYGPERQKTWFEYTQYFEVTGGYAFKFAGGPASESKTIVRPTFDQQKQWGTKFGGFLTKEEVDAIRTVETP